MAEIDRAVTQAWARGRSNEFKMAFVNLCIAVYHQEQEEGGKNLAARGHQQWSEDLAVVLAHAAKGFTEGWKSRTKPDAEEWWKGHSDLLIPFRTFAEAVAQESVGINGMGYWEGQETTAQISERLMATIENAIRSVLK